MARMRAEGVLVIYVRHDSAAATLLGACWDLLNYLHCSMRKRAGWFSVDSLLRRVAMNCDWSWSEYD